MNISKIFRRNLSFDIKQLKNQFLKSPRTYSKTIFTFSTSNGIVLNSSKINNLLSHSIQIKVWSLEGLIQKALDKQHNQTNPEVLSKVQQLIANQHKDTFNIVVNKFFSSIQEISSLSQTKNQLQVNKKQINQKALYKNLIEFINQSEKWSFLPHHHNITNRQKQSKSKQLKLLIGDYNDALIANIPPNSYVTLEELCAMYPQKVPLSYRKRQTIESIRQSLAKRLSEGLQKMINLNQQPRFNEIIIINEKIKMWDQAYQVMLDELPIKITLPFHLIEPSQKFHRLNLHNFIQGFRTCHRIIHPEIELQIQQQNIEQFLGEFLKNTMPNLPTNKFTIQVQVMDQSLIYHSRKRFQLVL